MPAAADDCGYTETSLPPSLGQHTARPLTSAHKNMQISIRCLPRQTQGIRDVHERRQTRVQRSRRSGKRNPPKKPQIRRRASDELIRSAEMFTSSPASTRLKETYLIITALITAGTITEIGCEETAAKIGLELPRSAGFLWVNCVGFH